MTKRRTEQRASQSCGPQRAERMASAAVDDLAPRSAPPVRSPYILLALCGLLLLAVIAVFGQAAGHDFVNFDDDQYVYDNWHVRGNVTLKGTAWAITTYHASNWHPLTWLSHMLDCGLYDLKPGGHHLTNVLLHAAAAILLLLALRRMTAALWPSAWVAAVFAIHPLRVESVAWVAERKDVLSGLFFMLTLCFYARYAERPASWGRYLLVVASFALGLTAKPMLVTLPFVLLLLDYWPLERLSRRRPGFSALRRSSLENEGSGYEGGLKSTLRPLVRLIVEKIPLFVLAAASCVVTLAAQRGAMRSFEQLAFAGRVANAAVAYLAYLGKMLYPQGLAVFYPLPRGPLPALGVIAAVSLLLAISTAAIAARRKCPYLLFGWLWYLGMLAPVIGLVQVGDQAMADRYTYLAQIGLYTAFAWGAADVAGSWPYRRWPFAAISALVVTGLMVCAWQQTRHWRDSETLWTHTLACSPQNPTAWTNLGNALARRGQVDEAIAHYRKALEIQPDFVEAHNNLGSALAGRGQVDEAIEHYQKALEIKPDSMEAHTNLGNALAGRGQVDEAVAHYGNALEIQPHYAEAHNDLGSALVRRGQVDEAIEHYQKALEIKPDYADAHYNLANVLAGRGQFVQAIAHYRKALEIKPEYAEAHSNLGNALAGCGQFDEALTHYRKALEIQPGYAEAHNNLAAALAGRGDVAGAIAHYRKALESKPDYAEAHYNLGLALAGRGQVAEAIGHYRKALEIRRDYVQAHNELGIALARHGQVDEAIACFRKALEIKPDYAAAHYDLALALAGRGQLDEVIEHLRKALEIEPDDLSAHYKLGLALVGRGRLDEALVHYRKALDLASARNDKARAEMIRAEIRRRWPVAPDGR